MKRFTLADLIEMSIKAQKQTDELMAKLTRKQLHDQPH